MAFRTPSSLGLFVLGTGGAFAAGVASIETLRVRGDAERERRALVLASELGLDDTGGLARATADVVAAESTVTTTSSWLAWAFPAWRREQQEYGRGSAMVKRADVLREMRRRSNTRTVSADASSSPASSSDGGIDVLVIGGGATGAGCALDAATRGLSTALIEREDFSSGTSSRSTKLLHGGVRYLEKAVQNFDLGQLKLVFEALHERAVVMAMAPHLTSALPILMPCYRWWELPYFWAGMKAYDLLSGTRMLSPSFVRGPRSTVESFPTLKERLDSGERLCGSITYYDGQMDDSRLNVTLATTAASAGAMVANYVDVVDVIKDKATGKVCGVIAKDRLSGATLTIRAKVVINAAGPFCDGLRKMADKDATTTVTPAAGAHISLPPYYVPDDVGLIVPKTKDGRVLFILPWMGVSLAGTTDSPSALTMQPEASAEDVAFILDTVKSALDAPIDTDDVLSAWSGLRPLASDPSKSNTESISRDHVCFVEDTGVVSITGGKWTTFRKMAEDAVDMAVQSAGLRTSRTSCTGDLKLAGAMHWNRTLHAELAKALMSAVKTAKTLLPKSKAALSPGDFAHARAIDVPSTAARLASAFGDRAWAVLEIATRDGLLTPLVQGHPVLEAEVVYAARHEYCMTASDFLARRSRLAFTHIDAAREALPRVIELLRQEHGWGPLRAWREKRAAMRFLDTFACAH